MIEINPRLPHLRTMTTALVEEYLMRTVIAAAAIALAPLSALAADMPVRAPAPAPVFVAPIFSWSGFYVGLNLGASFGGSDNAATIGTPGFVGLVAPGIAPAALAVGDSGFVGGAQAGMNWQMGAMVFGVEADIQFADQGKSASFIGANLPSPPFGAGLSLTTSANYSLDYFGTVRARLGFTPFDRMLVYATGGLAWGNAKLSNSVVVTQDTTIAWAGRSSSTKTGWTLGAGVEYALTQNFTMKAEYLYYDLGSISSYAAGNTTVRSIALLNGVDYVARKNVRGDIVRVGFNYKF
jgi:outer membrane immunogenic protein